MLFRILIVEDSAVFRSLLKEALQSRFPHIEISEVADGEDAMRKIGICVPDLVFMDIKLCDCNGLDLTARIKRKFPWVNVIVLTSYDTLEYREAAISAGASAFLAKASVTKEKLFDLVESMLSGS